MKKLLVPLLCFLFCACTSDDKKITGVSTVETENAFVNDSAFVVRVINADSTPAHNMVAKVRPIWYTQNLDTEGNNTNVEELTTDSLGRINLKARANDISIEIIDNNVGVFKQLNKDNIKNKNFITYTLEKLGSIEGKVELPSKESSAWIQVYGTDRLIKTDSQGNFKLDSMPPSEYRIRSITKKNAPAIGEGTFNLQAGATFKAGTLETPKTSDENLKLWPYSRSTSIDSIVPEWMKPITDTTIISIRLDSSNFNFKEAMPNGNDLRFTDQDSNRLESKIVYWNDTLQNAKILLRLENSKNINEILMYWGNTASLDINADNIWNNISDSLYKEINSLEIFNVNAGNLNTPFNYADGPRSWYFMPQDTNVTTIPSTEKALDAIEESENGEKVFHWKSQSTKPNLWSMVGIRLNNRPSDLSYIDSISFTAKGSGELGFAIEVLDEPTGKAKYVNYLDSTWKTFTFTSADFMEADQKYGNKGWDFVITRLTTISIWIVGDSEMWLDKVRIYGINRDDVN